MKDYYGKSHLKKYSDIQTGEKPPKCMTESNKAPKVKNAKKNFMHAHTKAN